jgi:hypothetical protein
MKLLLYILLGLSISMGGAACKAKHCVAYDDSMEGYKQPKKKTKRKEGLFDKKTRF